MLTMADQNRRVRFEGLRQAVPQAMQRIEALSTDQCRDERYLEHVFIPELGLNDEALNEQPAELSQYFGKGLHLWQYPNQLSRYLVWLASNATDISSYLEIGCRWGGTFILISEWLRKMSPRFKTAIAIDPVGLTPFIEEYFAALTDSKVTPIFSKQLSTSSAFAELVATLKPELVFVDGDHTLKGALSDHLLARQYARIVVHHDITSQVCLDTTLLWRALREMEQPRFEVTEFTDQYNSVAGSFLGIGVLKRREISAPHADLDRCSG
jgi:hypothetical protein